jgi:hypothetical protein
LHLTSWIMCLLHYYAVQIYGGPEVLQLCYISGIMTSVWNHGTVSDVAVWSDRMMMLCGFLIDLYFMSTLPFNQGILVFSASLLAVMFYFIAKAIQLNFCLPRVSFGGFFGRYNHNRSYSPISCFSHCLAHLSVTVSHTWMLYFLSLQSGMSVYHG